MMAVERGYLRMHLFLQYIYKNNGIGEDFWKCQLLIKV